MVSYQYTDFGETSIYGDTDFYNEICYNGAIYDESTGLYYLSARYYDPEDGRFLTRDSYRGNAVNPMTWHLYAYCANNPVNYEDPSGHAAHHIIGALIGGTVGVAVGLKLAKKTDNKWQKVAIVAGCAVIGGVVGALVGTAAKKIASKVVMKKKLPSPKKIYTAAKSTVQKVSNIAKKAVSKTKTVIKAANKFARNMTVDATKGAMEGAVQSKVTGGDVRNGAISGAISGAVSSAGGKAWSVVGSVAGGYAGVRLDGKNKTEALVYGGVSGVLQLGLEKINLSVDLPVPKTMLDNISNRTVNGILGLTNRTIGFTASISTDIIWDNGGRKKIFEIWEVIGNE